MRHLTTFVTGLALVATLTTAEAAIVSEEGHAGYFTTLDEGLKIASEKKQPLLIKFFTDWCTWCVTLDTVVMVDPAAISFFQDEVVLVKINAEVDTLIAQKYHVSGYPTSVLIGTDGEEIDRIIGYAPTEEFLGSLRDFSKGIGTLGDMLARAKNGTDRELYLEIANKYKFRGGPKEADLWFEKVVDAGEPLDSLTGEARIASANMAYRAKEYARSMELYEGVKKDFGPNQFGELADIYCAIIYKKQSDTTNAVQAFKQFMIEYPESEDYEYASEQIEKLMAIKDEETN